MIEESESNSVEKEDGNEEKEEEEEESSDSSSDSDWVKDLDNSGEEEEKLSNSINKNLNIGGYNPTSPSNYSGPNIPELEKKYTGYNPNNSSPSGYSPRSEIGFGYNPPIQDSPSGGYNNPPSISSYVNNIPPKIEDDEDDDNDDEEDKEESNSDTDEKINNSSSSTPPGNVNKIPVTGYPNFGYNVPSSGYDAPVIKQNQGVAKEREIHKSDSFISNEKKNDEKNSKYKTTDNVYKKDSSETPFQRKYSTGGSKLKGDFNSRFRDIISSGSGISDFLSEDHSILSKDKWQRNTDLVSLVEDFIFSARSYGRIIISEVYLPRKKKTIQPVTLGGKLFAITQKKAFLKKKKEFWGEKNIKCTTSYSNLLWMLKVYLMEITDPLLKLLDMN